MRPQPERDLMLRHLLIAAARTVFLLAAVTGCYGTPRSVLRDSGTSGGGTGGEGPGGTGGSSSTGGAGTGPAGTGGSGNGGSGPTFVGGPCIVSPDRTAVEVFARSSDGRVLRRAYDGDNWGGWINLPALDGNLVDARSDLDCAATLTTVHIVASGLNPVGALLRAFGSGTAYNPFAREAGLAFGPGPSVAQVQDGVFFLGGSGPALFELDGTSAPKELTPITTQTDPFRSGPDIAVQPTASMGFRYFAAVDAAGTLAIYQYITSSAPAYWANPVKLLPPVGSFAFSPTICTENGAYGVYSVNVVAVAGGRVWYARTSSIMSPFSAWTMIGTDAATSPDCAVAGEADSIVHVVTLSATGALLDINGKESVWVVTDLGNPL